MEDYKVDKYEYLKAPILLENFKQTYLTSLNIYLNDEKFREKTSALPKLKSSAITKFEKILQKEQKDKNFLPNLLIKDGKLKNSDKKKKAITLRYIVFDNELIYITQEALADNTGSNNKLTDPFTSYFKETNEKIRKKALEQIIANILPNKVKNKEKKEEDKKEDKKEESEYDYKKRELEELQRDIELL
ncbi:MAG: hypothetical protein MJ252_28460, partial [archaeon]|nr:hypothetical protein [archaeon]